MMEKLEKKRYGIFLIRLFQMIGQLFPYVQKRPL